MFVSGRFGLKSFDISIVAAAAGSLLDWLGDGANDPFVAEANPGNGSQAPRRGNVRRTPCLEKPQDMDVDQHRKLVFLSRDPARVRRGARATRPRVRHLRHRRQEPGSGFVSSASRRRQRATRRPASTSAGGSGQGGPAANTDQQGMGWAGRPIFVTDMRDAQAAEGESEPDRPRPKRRHDRLLP